MVVVCATTAKRWRIAWGGEAGIIALFYWWARLFSDETEGNVLSSGLSVDGEQDKRDNMEMDGGMKWLRNSPSTLSESLASGFYPGGGWIEWIDRFYAAMI